MDAASQVLREIAEGTGEARVPPGIPGIGPGGTAEPDAPLSPWSYEGLVGRLVEISAAAGSAALTAAMGLVLDAQGRGEPVAWVGPRASTFYPPDAQAGGVDLRALIVVRVPDAGTVARAADRLLRSGAFGLVVMDLAGGASERASPSNSLETSALTRLLGLARRHEAALVLVTRKGEAAPSVGSLVSVRVEARRERIGPGHFRCAIRALKDKRRGPGWTWEECRRGPVGLR
ncbi:MAG: recombinase A [Myxococcales bacterium]|nr:recombinase A [Myxococcales bacterium]